MARLQATIDDKTAQILEQLLRRNDRARFIELAIQKAKESPEFCKLFAWKEPSHTIETPIKPEKRKITFDDEF